MNQKQNKQNRRNMAQVLKGTDMNGNPVQMTVDLSKGVTIENIPAELQWKLKTIDENLISETNDWVGAMKKR